MASGVGPRTYGTKRDDVPTGSKPGGSISHHADDAKGDVFRVRWVSRKVLVYDGFGKTYRGHRP